LAALKVIKHLGLLDELKHDLAMKGSDWKPGYPRRCVECGANFIGVGRANTCSLECAKEQARKRVRRRRREGNVGKSGKYCKGGRPGSYYADCRKIILQTKARKRRLAGKSKTTSRQNKGVPHGEIFL
jgi:hypothetical protein